MDALCIREDEELERGGVLKGTIQAGDDGGSPAPGDLVFLHYTIMDSEENVVESTRAEAGGPGHARPFVIGGGKSKGKGMSRPLRGIELALTSGMRLKERCILHLKPEFAYFHKDCEIKPPMGLQVDEPIIVDVELVAWRADEKAKAVGPNGEVILRTKTEGSGWETPRPPFDVTLKASARMLSTTTNAPYFESKSAMECCLGDGILPPGIEYAVCDMHRGEEAIIWCPASIAAPNTSGSTLIPGPPLPPPRDVQAIDDGGFPWLQYVEITVSLLDFRQVRDLAGDGRAMKRIIVTGNGEFPADCPLEDTTVRCKVRIRSLPSSSGDWVALPGSKDAIGTLEMVTGMDAVPLPVESSLRLMLRGEVASVRCDWAYAYNDRVDAPEDGVIRKEGEIEFEIELVDFDPIQNWSALDGAGKLELAGKWREQGNTLFKLGRYKHARQKYLKGIRCVDQALDLEVDEEVNAAKAAKLACLVNLAACAQKEEEWGEVIKWCDKALG